MTAPVLSTDVAPELNHFEFGVRVLAKEGTMTRLGILDDSVRRR
jgi:hypothetical protein